MSGSGAIGATRTRMFPLMEIDDTSHARPYLKIVAFAIVIGAAFLVARHFGAFRYTDLHELAAAVQRARGISFIAPLFVLIYALATTFGLPGTPLTLAGGAIFGFVYGTLLNWLGATLGSLGAYTLARLLGQDALRRILGSRASMVEQLVTDHGFTAVLRLRLLPLVPFNGINFASGFAAVDVKTYIVATALGILPGTAVYTYFADALLSGVAGARSAALLRASIAGVLLVILSFAPGLIEKHKAA